MSKYDVNECCPPFDPDPWSDREIHWQDKLFVKDRVTSFLRIPLNFGAVMKRNMAAIEAAGATLENMVVLADENSLWGADVYIEVGREVPGSFMATLSGNFLSRVYEGSFRNMSAWVKDMKTFVQSRDKTLDKIYFYYTTCPRCARKYGKNYVVLLARV